MGQISQAVSLEQLYVGYHTLVRMTPRQVAGIGERKARELLLPRFPVDFDARYERLVPANPSLQLDPIIANTAMLRSCLEDGTRQTHRTRAEEAARGTPTFLNRSLRVSDDGSVDWYDSRFGDLPVDWSLKLYGFQPLSWVCTGFAPHHRDALALQRTFDEWIRDWTDSVEIGRSEYLRRAWTPWSVSLRILHWCRYLGWRRARGSADDGTSFEPLLGGELYKNALFLDNHIERDVGGNHLIENGAALAIAGVVLSVESWIDTGVSILSEAAAEQFLDDGCHFERSPMYHVLTLTRYLTVCDILAEVGRPVPSELWMIATKATAFLDYIRPPNGRIPLLNDSVYGQALPLDACLRYAEAVGVGSDDAQRAPSTDTDGTNRQESAYRWLETAAGTMLTDGGAVGPPHLPGHSHSDTLGVLLWLDEQPVVTDTGTFGYVSGEFRDYARGVSGHNTVQVADTEPIAFSGKFLMGPRPEPETRFTDDGEVSLVEGCYDTAPFRSEPYTHHRAVYAGDDWWTVWDTVVGSGRGPIRSRLHLHPDIAASFEATGQVRFATSNDTPLGFVHPLEASRTALDTGWYFPEFGVAVQRPVLELRADEPDADTVSFGFLITQQDCKAVAIETADRFPGLKRLHVGDEVGLPETRLLSD